MGILAFLKYAVNTTIGEDFFNPIDKLMCAQILCTGEIGTKFLIERLFDRPTSFEVEITEDSDTLLDLRHAEFISVPLGSYKVIVTPAGTNTNITCNIVVETLGVIYPVVYEIEVARLTTNGTFTPTDLGMHNIIAAGGGGGGGSGSSGNTSGAAGGSGGCCIKATFSPASLSAIPITIGAGGAAGASGGSTVIGSVVTVAGGLGGTAGGTASAGSGSGTGGAGAMSSNEYISGDGGDGLIGKGGSGSKNANKGSGGGGGGSYGNGGDGGIKSSNKSPTKGSLGGGGGGGIAASTGAAGGSGIVIIYKLFGEGYK